MGRLLNPWDRVVFDSVLARLSMSDKVRLAGILSLLREAPDDLRAQTERELRALLLSKPRSYEACTAALDAIIVRASRKLAGAGRTLVSDTRRG